MKEKAGTFKCCSHESYECLPLLCPCCQAYASVTINVIDMSDYLVNTRKSFDNITVDSNFLHEPITKDMLMHEPYTPESVDSHSPTTEKLEQIEVIPVTRRSVSPYELKTKLEDILRIENAKSQKFLMKRSTSQYITKCASPEYFRDRSMSEVPRKPRQDSIVSSSNKLNSSSDENWFEFDDLLESKHENCVDDTFVANVDSSNIIAVDDSCLKSDVNSNKKIKSKSMKSKVKCCLIM